RGRPRHRLPRAVNATSRSAITRAKRIAKQDRCPTKPGGCAPAPRTCCYGAIRVRPEGPADGACTRARILRARCERSACAGNGYRYSRSAASSYDRGFWNEIDRETGRLLIMSRELRSNFLKSILFAAAGGSMICDAYAQCVEI